VHGRTYPAKPLNSLITSPWAIEERPGAIVAATRRDDHTRLFTASANATRLAAERLRMDRIDLAEQLADGKLADMRAPGGEHADFAEFARFVLGVVRGYLAGEAEDLGALADWIEGEIHKAAAARVGPRPLTVCTLRTANPRHRDVVDSPDALLFA
jgi:hypothetical protein